MDHPKTLTRIWSLLMGLTLFTALIAEASQPALWALVLINLIIAIKGSLVVDYLMGLRFANRTIRRTLLAYFYLLPPLIIAGVLYSEPLRTLTTL